MAGKHMRSPLSQASGFGSAKEGVQDWWRERVTAVALVPLTLWFLASIIAHSRSDYTGFVAWLRLPLSTLMMTLLLVALFYHTALGLQVIIEDYVHSAIKIPALIVVRLACVGLVATGILAVFRIVFGH